MAALASLLDPQAFAAADASPPGAGRPGPHTSRRGEERHLPLHGRRAVARRSVRPQADAARAATARRCPRRSSATQRVTLMTRNQGHFQTAATPSASPSTASAGHEMSELLAAPGRRSPTSCASSARCTPSRSITTRPSPSCRPAGRSRACRAWARGSATAWARENRDLPAFVVMISGAARSADPVALLPQRLPARRSTRACSSRPRATRCCTCRTRRASTRRRAATLVDGINELNRLRHAAGRATRRSRRASTPSSWPSACRPRVPELMDIAERDRRTLRRCTAPTSTTPGTLRPQLPAGPPAGRARRPLRAALPPRLGPARRRRQRPRRQMPRRRSARRRPARATCKQRGLLDDTLVIWGGEFGRTAYGQGDLTRRLRPRPPPALLHLLAGRRRHQAAASPTARPTTSATTSPRTRSTSTTCTPPSCTCSASTTSG